MKNKNVTLIITLAFSMAIFNTFGTYATSSSDDDNLSIQQMEDLKKANQQQIEDLQNQIESVKDNLDKSKNDETLKQQYQDILNNKIELQEENISYVEDQLSMINDEISSLNDNISYLEDEMSSLEVNIDTNMEQFKKRLRAMYISGNDSFASVLMGATDFFDVLSKMEFINRISSHDNALMETLKSQIQDYNEDKEILSQAKSELEDKQTTLSNKRDEFNTILSELSEDYKNTQDELDKISLEKENLNSDLKALQQYQKEQEEEEKKIQKAIEDYYIQSSISESQSISESESVSKSESIYISQSISQSISESISLKEEEAKNTTVNTSPQTVNTVPVTIGTQATTQNPYQNRLTSGFFNWPVPGVYTITDYYTIRTWNSQGMHYGIDISGANVMGADIVAAESGTVILVSNYCTHNYPKYSSCGCGGGFGNYVIIDHGNGYATLYGHCQSIDVSMGQHVSRGQTIAHVGTTGYSTGYHLHFEVRQNGQRIDPLPFLS